MVDLAVRGFDELIYIEGNTVQTFIDERYL